MLYIISVTFIQDAFVLIPFFQSFVLFHLRSHFQKFLSFFSQTFQLFSSDFFRFRCSRFRLRLNDVRAVPARHFSFQRVDFRSHGSHLCRSRFRLRLWIQHVSELSFQIREFLRYGARRGGGGVRRGRRARDDALSSRRRKHRRRRDVDEIAPLVGATFSRHSPATTMSTTMMIIHIGDAPPVKRRSNLLRLRLVRPKAFPEEKTSPRRRRRRRRVHRKGTPPRGQRSPPSKVFTKRRL